MFSDYMEYAEHEEFEHSIDGDDFDRNSSFYMQSFSCNRPKTFKSLASTNTYKTLQVSPISNLYMFVRFKPMIWQLVIYYISSV